MASNDRSSSHVRESALWGTSQRGGEHRSSALWGRGGRGAVIALAAAFVLTAPIAAFAGGGNGNSGKGNGGDGKTQRFAVLGGVKGDGVASSTYVPQGLWKQAKANGNKKIRVIIQSLNGGVANAESAFNDAVSSGGNKNGDRVARRLNLVGGVAVELTAKRLAKLAQNPNLIITPDAPVKVSGLVTTTTSNGQQWPYSTGAASLWPQPGVAVPDAPTIAVVDSGVDPATPGLEGRLYPQVNLSSLTPDASGDDRGHGTFVASIAAGLAPGYAGAAPTARVLSIRVMNEKGMAMTSDVVNAAQWILANKDAYNIRVANFSLHSSTKTHFWLDPLDRAVEKLWFNGVVVVAAAGNYGTGGTPSRVLYAPGNDPFVITVGATDVNTTISAADDTAAPWSAYGYTEDGFSKPDISAPGRFMIGAVPVGSTLALDKPDHVVAPGYIALSGTSFAAPVAAGAAAVLLSRHPSWTPDQVKGALMMTATATPAATPGALGVGELSVSRANRYSITPNPNRALEQFVATDPIEGTVFDSASWNAVAASNTAWDAASWADASWANASWNAASWADASWSDASWADASWADASWADASWADMSVEDGAEGDISGSPSLMDPAEMAAVMADPDLALPFNVGLVLPSSPAQLP
jgi:serine protease AprX